MPRKADPHGWTKANARGKALYGALEKGRAKWP